MGCDIWISYEARNKNGEWFTIDVPKVGRNNDRPFDIRSYRTFRFLGGYYGPQEMEPIAECRGYPEDYEDRDLGDACGASWLTVEELLAFNYDQPSGVETETYRETLSEGFFEDLARLKEHGVERIVFSFWN